MKFQHASLVKVKTEEDEDSKSVALEVVTQDGTEQVPRTTPSELGKQSREVAVLEGGDC